MLTGFEPLNVVSGAPTLTLTKNGIGISKAAILKLGKAPFVALLLNRAEHQIAIQACDKETPGAVSFFNPQKKAVAVRWNNKDLIDTIEHLMGWNAEKSSYRSNGTFLEEDRAIVFDLNQAEIF